MKATIDFDDLLYRHLKVEAARRGQSIRELVAEGVRYVLGAPPSRPAAGDEPSWAGSLSAYAANARGAHDLTAIRRRITRARKSVRK